MNHTFMKKIS